MRLARRTPPAPRATLADASRSVTSSARAQTALAPRVGALAAAPRPLSPAATPAARTRALVDNGASICASMTRPDRDRRFVARSDAQRAAVDGAQLDAMVSRGAAASLPSSWEPDDLVELPSLRTITARECSHRGAQCLRRPAAEALLTMLAAMRADGVAGSIHSTFRSYDVQCMVFRNWAYDDGRGFCRAATGSALPGHSQHQLGTTLDLLSVAWKAQDRGLSADFGCSPAGRWIAAHAEAHGFVLPYPLHADYRERGESCGVAVHGAMDPRTGYAYEPWHLRYLGPALVRELADARARSTAAGSGELTVDQWLRQRAGRVDDADLPVCDGCACGACSTLDGTSAVGAPCARDEMLVVDSDGKPVISQPPAAVTITRATARRERARVVIEATLSVPAGVVTQTPVAARDEVRFEEGEDSARWAPRASAAQRAFRDLTGAVRFAVSAEETGPQERFAHRVGITSGHAAAAFNGAVVYLPAPSGSRRVRLSIATRASRVRVALWADGRAASPSEIPVEER
jgi:D-alanyl-D-alanine carboxypeptidase